MPIVSISMDRLLCSLLIAPKGKKRRPYQLVSARCRPSGDNPLDPKLPYGRLSVQNQMGTCQSYGSVHWSAQNPRFRHALEWADACEEVRENHHHLLIVIRRISRKVRPRHANRNTAIGDYATTIPNYVLSLGRMLYRRECAAPHPQPSTRFTSCALWSVLNACFWKASLS